MIIWIKVIPNAPRNVIEEFQDGILKVRIQAVPDKGKANSMLIAFLAEEWKVPKSHIEILSGHSSRLKRVKIEGIEHIP